MLSPDVATWLARYGDYNLHGPQYEWDYDEIIPAHAPEAVATGLIEAAASSGKQAALALDALAAAMQWLAEICGDSSNAQPRVPGGWKWLETFADHVLDQPSFIRGCVLAYTPPVPLVEQAYVDRHTDAYLGKYRAPARDKVDDLATELARDTSRTPADSEQLWWAINGGSIGIASQLVRSSEICAFHPSDRYRRPAVIELRRHVVEATHDALIAGVPFWARAWLVEHIATVDRALLEDLIVQEQVPWLADQMRFELALSATERMQRWASWLKA
jgi:hypothetical protein